MPSWSRPTDIWFDYAAAEAAIEAVAAMRFVLALTWTVEETAARAALDSWDGAAASAFETSLRARGNATAELVDRLGLLEVAIRTAAEEAVLRQRRIDDLQAEWDAELRRERLVLEAELSSSSQARGFPR